MGTILTVEIKAISVTVIKSTQHSVRSHVVYLNSHSSNVQTMMSTDKKVSSLQATGG